MFLIAVYGASQTKTELGTDQIEEGSRGKRGGTRSRGGRERRKQEASCAVIDLGMGGRGNVEVSGSRAKVNICHRKTRLMSSMSVRKNRSWAQPKGRRLDGEERRNEKQGRKQWEERDSPMMELGMGELGKVAVSEKAATKKPV